MTLYPSPSDADDGAPTEPRRRWKMLWWIIGGIALLVLIVIGARYRAAAPPPVGRGGAGGPLAVGVATVSTGDVPITINALGTVTPLATVTVHPQINGPLVKIAFTEGQMVKAGDLLVLIDPRPYQAVLDQVAASSSTTRQRSPMPKSIWSATRRCWRRIRCPIRPTPRRWRRWHRTRPRSQATVPTLKPRS